MTHSTNDSFWKAGDARRRPSFSNERPSIVILTMTADLWIYHERQEALLCGQHALNNLAQAPLFTVDQLAEIARQLDALERGVMEPSAVQQPSANIDEAGNFSIQVLKAALEAVLGLPLPHLSVARQTSTKDITEYDGFLCHKSDHWFAIRQVGGRFWNLNSMMERPVAIGHFKLAVEMSAWESSGYTIFAIPEGLPVGGTKTPGTPEKCWHLMSNLLQGRDTAADPWVGLSGAGMRLDHASSTGSEDDDLQRALKASLAEANAVDQLQQLASVEIPPEPTSGGVRLQLRLPNGQRLVRRFCPEDGVLTIYAVVAGASPGAGVLELRYGFPPKDLAPKQSMSIGEAGLAGESIQGRYV